ncbi:J domain-containing protein [Aureimonas leprariae]|uniref:J domain-containing protein n=1 Tax=Plantimonas leprariae TaxID=2615207 RepID=A0A7V7TV69_9HYPH|nr:DnaJ domain-containing protein [Aureimonas leprariae]KAB0677049.1 J domain-containing protein [Aureimonas leprariae]
MKLDSKLFDGIRIRPDAKVAEKAKAPVCEWQGCEEPGIYKAPRGRDHEGQYLHFCVDHVRQYNKSYNYFSGLNDKDIQSYLKDAMTGHRPTWTMGADKGASPAGQPPPRAAGRRWSGRTRDPFNLFEESAAAERRRPKPVRSLEAKAFETMNLAPEAPATEIRARYKALVKQYHPDSNGGDRGHEDRLREVIQAYKLLKQSGFC